MNILSKLPLTEKQKDTIAQKRILASIGNDFFKLSLDERQKLRTEYRAKLDNEINGEKKQSERKLQIAVPPEEQKLAPEADTSITIGEQEKKIHETFSLQIQLNARQQLAADFAEAGKTFVLTGAAGTGKTTACREIAKRLLIHGKLKQHDFKLKGGGRVWAPSVAFCSYTNRASDNLRRALHKDPDLEEKLSVNIVTVHRLLEYEPIFYEVIDDKTKEIRTTMRFEPQRNASNPLHITHLVIEESSMLGLDLYEKLFDALPAGCQIIFVGDINQLPPIFSKSILNYALVTVPVVELTEVYRQALDSPIIANAHRCLRGDVLEENKPAFSLAKGKNVSTIPSESITVQMVVNSLKKWMFEKDEKGEFKYDPEQDIVLSPFNKGECGTIVLNNHIAQFLGQKRNAMVYEIIAGIRKLYLAEGDRVMIDKQDGTITEIKHNSQYIGRMPKPASTQLTRFGIVLLGQDQLRKDEDLEIMLEGYENLNVAAIPDEDEKRKQQSSHIVKVALDNGAIVQLSTAGDLSESSFSLGYALTVHKAQGCEWRKVIFVMHKNHAVLLTRELLYTAMTRAREYLIIVDLCNQLDKTIANQKIKGNSVEEKIEWFNSEFTLNEQINIIP